jgi:GNAT superfamily N-acetyltransferase
MLFVYISFFPRDDMTNLFTVRHTRVGEEVSVCNLVARSFNEYIAPGFSEEGIEEFFKYSNPRAFKRRLESGYFTMVAESGGKLAGMIEMRENKHISMLYVDKAYHRKGVAKELVRQAMEEISSNNESPKDITVNSSRYAVPFYERLGFIQYEDEKSIYGVIHIPMMVTYSKLRGSLL